jgi:protein SCO1/2
VRHPWWFATIFGLILIPAIRPCTRHVPEPPPIFGILPELVLTDSRGETFGTENLKQKVWVLSFYQVPCDADCERTFESMKALKDRLVRAKTPVSLLSIATAAPSETATIHKTFIRQSPAQEDAWPLTFGSQDVVTHLREMIAESTQKQFRPGQHEVAPVPSIGSSRLILLDWRARIRGTYPATPLGVDEIFHRSQHVLRQMSEQLQG